MNLNWGENKLGQKISDLLHGQPIDDVAPVLIVAVARALVIEADGDRLKFESLFARFVSHLSTEMRDMWEELEEARTNGKSN